MTNQAEQPSTGEPPRHGRHRDRSRNRTLTIIAVVVAVVAAAAVTTWLVVDRSGTAATTAAAPSSATATRPGSSPLDVTSPSPSRSTPAGPAAPPGATGCPLPGGTLTVAAAPEIAGVLSQITSGAAGIGQGCTVTVTPTEPTAVVATGGAGIDVWIPDSSIWIERAAAAAMTAPAHHPSIASSPVVLALPAATAARLTGGGTPGVAAILGTRLTASPVRVGLPDPQQSAEAVGAILGARAVVTGTPDARAALTWAVRSGPPGLPIDDDALLTGLATDPNTAVPVTERAVVAHNGAAGSAGVVAVYPGTGGVAMDFPVVTLTTDQQAVAAADDLATVLADAPAQTALQAAGFRAPDGSAGPGLGANLGVNPAIVVASPVPSLQTVDDTIRSVQITNEPSRMLAVMDISGSMESAVPGSNGATRMDLANEAATRGLSLYPGDSEIGLWVFSRTLTPDSDHRELIPVSTLGPDGQGGSGAQRLAQALAGIQAIPDGGTGLYDTVLDAVRTMRAGWDPTKVNAVLILSDGMNDDAGSISLDGLLSTLTAEQDPDKPVPVISIAFGPDSDVQALSQISRATGGAAYESRDPRQIGEIFLDAVGQRLCRPSC